MAFARIPIIREAAWHLDFPIIIVFGPAIQTILRMPRTKVCANIPPLIIRKFGKSSLQTTALTNPKTKEPMSHPFSSCCVSYHSIGAQNWESPFFETWILQILLSEMMEVPVTVETGVSEGSVSFYDLETRMTYGSANEWDAFRTVGEYKDCRAVPQREGDDYIPCHHLIPEGTNRCSGCGSKEGL